MQTITRFFLLLALLRLALGWPRAERRSEPAPLLAARGDDSDMIAGSYIVKFRDDCPTDRVKSVVQTLGLAESLLTVFSGAVFTGFAADMADDAVEVVRQHSDVEYVEQAAVVQAKEYTTQTSAGYGLARISHRKRGASDYVYDESAGEGTCSYVIDSLVELDHPDFEGRVTYVNVFNETADNEGCDHGTKVAGVIGSKTYGVAKKTRIYSIKTNLPKSRSKRCDCYTWKVIAAVNAVVTDLPRRNCPAGVVVNISLGQPYSKSLNDAVSALTRLGIFVAVCAGNENKDAARRSPSSAEGACCVGGIDSTDHRYKDSNYGSRVDVAAPAIGVMTTTLGGGFALGYGTSISSPIVAGLAAYLMGLNGGRNGTVRGDQMCALIRDMATRNAIVDQKPDTRNLIAFNGNPRGNLTN